MKRSTMIRDIKMNYEKKRLRAHRKQEEKRKAIYDSVPELEEINGQITRLGLSVSRALLAGQSQQQVLSRLQSEMNHLTEKKQTLLQELGLSEQDLQPEYDCSDCQDRGILESGKHCHCYQQELINRAYAMSNLSGILEKENFRNFRLDLFSDKAFPEEKTSPRENMMHILQRCEGFVFNFDAATTLDKPNLLFYGATGLGKTFMANCIAKGLLDRGKIVIYQTAYQLISLLEKHQFQEKQDPQTIRLLSTCDLLILDDLGTELTNSFTNSQLFQLVNTRHLEGTRTLISTNLTPKELMLRYDDRICSRLFAYYDFIKFFGNDLRWQPK
ncbi:DNA replication protein DnaC [Tindallia magadiensis]|uniref:DNA replication protein DnaC n=1 Tax=Tindallia magadiensis TaxID=69895 RepID=A0A1I3GHJ5_9FIRM|nr:ATP-binding protein [Tindallia magadiensis]SFI22621.1 DNA replication protein DnaC [Tindallia magadiensis]